MKTTEDFKIIFNRVRGKTIALVYIFEGDNSSGFEHFFIWKSSIIAEWMKAIQEINCLPLIMDVRTFVEKAINNTLPHIDYVLNMNSGTYDLSSMALVPSTCSSIGVPCIPCSAVSIVVGESKRISNLLADSIGLNVPKNISQEDENGIFRPINLGNSLGVTRGMNKKYSDGIYQEFIAGYEITTPAAYNVTTKRMELLPTVMYLPESKDINWFNGEKEKQLREGYEMKIVNLDSSLIEKYHELMSTLSLNNFCRIDARVKCEKNGFYHDSKNNSVSSKDTYFIEINVMPTIRENNNFYYSFNNIDEKNTFYMFIKAYKNFFGSISLNSFLLMCSLLSVK